MHRFSRNSQSLNGIMWKFPIPNFTQVGQGMQEVGVEISLYP